MHLLNAFSATSRIFSLCVFFALRLHRIQQEKEETRDESGADLPTTLSNAHVWEAVGDENTVVMHKAPKGVGAAAPSAKCAP